MNDNDSDGNSHEKDVDNTDFTTTNFIFGRGGRGPRVEEQGKPRPFNKSNERKYLIKKLK